MKTRIRVIRMIAGIAALMLAAPPQAGAQQQMPPPPPAADSAQFTAAQLAQLLAPIALYPDSLLAQILMAATYPLEVVQADRWLQDPANAALKGTELDTALDPQPWDPSVKSLVPFPQILRMMDSNLGWTEQLGDAFLAQQPDVTDAIQRLRQEAQAAGRLQSTPEASVSSADSAIVIAPTDPAMVYVPVYDPTVVYGIWAYPDYPPYYFPGFFTGVVVGDLGFGWLSFSINAPLWGWSGWDWGRRQVYLNPGRFNAINGRHRPPINSGVWRHDPAHRGHVPYRDPGTQTRFGDRPRTPDERRTFRGYPASPAPTFTPSAPAQRHQGNPRPVAPRPPSASPPAAPPAFESFGRGAEVRTQSQRGSSSRQSMPAPPAGGGNRPAGVPGGGRGGNEGGGGDRRHR